MRLSQRGLGRRRERERGGKEIEGEKVKSREGEGRENGRGVVRRERRGEIKIREMERNEKTKECYDEGRPGGKER